MTATYHLAQNKRIALALIIGLAALLRFYHITGHDSYTDEAALGFRAIGLIDYNAVPQQTTPWQWLGAVPWWAHLSFHDHPILFFLLQHFSIKLFGIGLFALRLPSVLAGVGSVFLVFFIGRKLWREEVGLIAAGLLAVSSYHLWVSRLGIQDSMVIFFILLALLFLLRAREDARWWFGFWAVFGLGVITKYTILITLPVALWYAALNKWKFYQAKPFWQGLILCFVITMPAWLYNLMLYRERGHFDFQLSAVLGQTVPEWSFRYGRSLTGGLVDRFQNFFRALHQSNSLVFNLLLVSALWFGLVQALIGKRKNFVFLLGTLGLFFLWFMVVGSTYRFVVMILPFLTVLFAGFIYYGWSYFLRNRKQKICFGAGVILFFLFELFYSINTYFLAQPVGRDIVAYAHINEETQNFGFNELNDYLDGILAGKLTYFVGQPEYKFLADRQTAHINRLKRSGAAPYPIVVVYERDLNFLARLWTFQRRLVYEGWPMLADDEFLAITGEQLDEFYRAQGVRKFIYVTAAGTRVRKPAAERRDAGRPLREYLGKNGIKPLGVKNQAGEEAFLVYEF